MKNVLTGEIKVSIHQIDQFQHLYNGNYARLIRKILKKEKRLPIYEEILNTEYVAFEKYLLKEHFIFKGQIPKGSKISYNLTETISDSDVISITGVLLFEGKIVTKVNLEIGMRRAKENIEAEKTMTFISTDIIEPFDFVDFNTAAHLFISKVKSNAELSRGRWLSEKYSNHPNYYKMQRATNIAFWVRELKVKYFAPIHPGEEFSIRNFIEEKKLRNIDQFNFFQRLESKHGLKAFIESSLIKVDLKEKGLV